MAIQARFTETMPFVCTPTQKEIIDRESDRRGVSKAVVIREAFDAYWGLVDSEVPSGSELPEAPVHERLAGSFGQGEAVAATA